MSFVYTIENTFDDNCSCIHTSTVLATDDLNKAKEIFNHYKNSCKNKINRNNNEYILYQWNKCKILDRCDDYKDFLPN